MQVSLGKEKGFGKRAYPDPFTKKISKFDLRLSISRF